MITLLLPGRTPVSMGVCLTAERMEGERGGEIIIKRPRGCLSELV